MPKKLTPEQRNDVLRMLACGEDRDTIAAAIGVTPGQVSAISAHVRMGTYKGYMDDKGFDLQHLNQTSLDELRRCRSGRWVSGLRP